MGKWTIYRKNGDVVAVTGILDAGNFVLPELSYSGTWMGERFVTVSVKSPYPIDWQIGDYLIYRNEKFVLNYDPTVVKKARKGTSGEGFVYDGVKFNSLSCECGDVRFLDEVLQDSHIHYTSLSTFTFFAATADDLADRLQANMNRYCSANGFSVSDWWLILTPSLERSRARALASGGSALAEEAVSRWNEFYTDGVSVDGERFNQNVSVSDISVLDGFALLYNLFGLHFITSGRTLAAGVSGKIAEHIFEYGKGKGLYELEKVADGNQAIVTKLFAYGNSTNLPVRYYARLNKTCFAKVRSVETGGTSFVIDIPFAYSYYNGSKNPSVASGSFQVAFLYGGKQYTCYAASDRGYPVSKQEGYSYLSAFIGGIPSLSVGETITFVSGIDDDKWPSGHFSYVNDGSVLPDNLAISHLMLPGFPSESLRSWVLRNGGVEKGEGLIAWRGYEAYFSEDPLSPYVQSANAKKLGVRESSLVFDGSNGTDDIHPTITGSGKDVVLRCDMIADNGIFGEGEEVPNFHLVIPSLGEDVSLDILLRSDAKISMKDGYCGGMEFNIESVNVVEDGWELTLNRAYDDALQLYFPYSFGASLGNEPSASESYQIRKGDTFVLLGIELPSSYIGMASERLLEGALQSLSGNDYTRHTYVPRVDEIYMARQHDAVVRGVDELQYGTVSLHDTLREGDLMRFEDADLSVGGTIFIDQLQIKEYGNKQIPTYDVTLRESKSVGTIERIQQEIDDLSQNKSGGSGGGVSTSQVKSILNMYGDKRYIRRDIDDETDTILGAKQFVAKEKVVADRIKSKTEDAPVVVENDLNVEGDSSVKGDMNVEGAFTTNGKTELAKGGGETSVGGDLEVKDELRVKGESAVRTVVFGDFVKGLLGVGTSNGAEVSEDGTALFRKVEIGEALIVPEIQFNRASVTVGIGLTSVGGGIIEEVYAGDTSGRASLRLEDGEFGAVALGDKMLGFWHNITDNATSNSDNRNGDYELQGFQSIYFVVDGFYANEIDFRSGTNVKDVPSGNNKYFHYALRTSGVNGWTKRHHPHAGLHFGLIANNINEDRQALKVTTTQYELRLQHLTDWNYTHDNIVKIDGKLDGFSMSSQRWNGTEYEQYVKTFSGNGTVLGNAYIYGRLDQFERVAYRCFVDQSLGGSIGANERETETVTVWNGYGEDVTGEFTRFSVTRDSGDTSSDAAWNAAHTNVGNPFYIAFADLGIDGINRISTQFYVTATNEVSGDVTSAAMLEFL